MLTSKSFWLAVLERAVKTFAQSAAALLLASGAGLLDAHWLTVASVAGMAAVVSLLTSVGTGAMSDGNPAIGSTEVLATPGAAADPVAGVPVEVDAAHTQGD